jgi:hypothetical protein
VNATFTTAPLSGDPKQPKNGMHISALAGIDDIDKKQERDSRRER